MCVVVEVSILFGMFLKLEMLHQTDNNFLSLVLHSNVQKQEGLDNKDNSTNFAICQFASCGLSIYILLTYIMWIWYFLWHIIIHSQLITLNWGHDFFSLTYNMSLPFQHGRLQCTTKARISPTESIWSVTLPTWFSSYIGLKSEPLIKGGTISLVIAPQPCWYIMDT